MERFSLVFTVTRNRVHISRLFSSIDRKHARARKSMSDGGGSEAAAAVAVSAGSDSGGARNAYANCMACGCCHPELCCAESAHLG